MLFGDQPALRTNLAAAQTPSRTIYKINSRVGPDDNGGKSSTLYGEHLT
jgi:hypothetical protein